MQPHETVVMDDTHFDDLQSQILGTKEANSTPKVTDKPKVETKESKSNPEAYSGKKYSFVKGSQRFDIDDDAEIEFMADKKPLKMTLRELKDRAAGDVAVKNRMHSLAEEKKKIQSTFKEFASLAKNDPLAALEYISSKANEADSEFEYNKYLEMLAEQAEKLGAMDEKERKAWEVEKKLKKAEENLSLNERKNNVALRKHEILSDYPEIGDSQFADMIEEVLSNDDLLEGAESESDVLDKVENLIQETLVQRDIMSVIDKINPAYTNDTSLIFSLSDQIRLNPDLDEEDIMDIIRDVVPPRKAKVDSRNKEREEASKTLSRKARQNTPVQQLREQESDDFDLLAQQLIEKNKEQKRTPLYMR